jgi:hypothetical protein
MNENFNSLSDKEIIEKWKDYTKDLKFKTYYALLTTSKYADYHFKKLGEDLLKESLKILTDLLLDFDKNIKLEENYENYENIEQIEVSTSINWANFSNYNNNYYSILENVLINEIKNIFYNKLKKNLYLYIHLLLIETSCFNDYSNSCYKIKIKSKVIFTNIVDERKRKLNNL